MRLGIHAETCLITGLDPLMLDVEAVKALGILFIDWNVTLYFTTDDDALMWGTLNLLDHAGFNHNREGFKATNSGRPGDCDVYLDGRNLLGFPGWDVALTALTG